MTTNEPPNGPHPENPEGPVPPPPPPADGSTSYPPPGGDTGGFGSGGYPPPPPPGDSGFVPPFSAPDAISYGWKKFTGNVGQWLLAGLAIFAVMVVFGLLSWTVQPSVEAGDTNPLASFNFATIVVNLLSTIVGYVISGFLYRGALDEAEGRKFSLADTMSRVPIVPVILTSILVSIGVTIGIVLCVLPGIVFAFLSYFALLFVVDKNQSPVQAIKSSISLISANFGQALLLAVLSFLVVLVGACLCGVGLLVAYPVVTIASAFAYKRFQNEPVAI